jgi:hypothetical protein
MEIVGNFHFCRSDIIGQGASGIVFKGCSILVSICGCFNVVVRENRCVEVSVFNICFLP